MPILELRFSNKSLHQLPHPLTSRQEYRDIHCQNLRALVYPNRITLAFRATINNQRIYETLGQFPQLCVEDARQHVMKLLADKNRLAVQSRRFTVEQAINDLWLPDLQLYKKSPQSELSKLNLYVRPFWGKRQLRDITAGELEQYAAGLREKLRPSTVNRILAILSKICSLAVRAGWITHSPMTHVRYLKENNIRYRTLSATEIPRFIDAATALQTPAADSILLALYTGMRIGEVCPLKWEYWHPDMHQLILPDTKSGHPFTCPLAPPAIAVVECQQDLMLSKTYIFPQLTDNARPLAYPRATFARICRDANIDNLRMHDLRRTFATRVLQATGDIAIASHLLNHHSLTATRRYAFHNAATSHAVVSQVIESYDTKMNL
ncbi:TPA: site-specific integrase [Escherichia coli]|uniref:tyrosine-type recombinase/integrase n=1 Tax=Escherichia coli TaxID=562 RepID=UPI001BCD92B7|nr:site-specific integrase [Escherichia coli]MBS4321832.1 tyrosine-type recombinase/integrase [Escherichia coli]HCX4180618.1 site-specific integrase [Escherichia coli]